MLVSDLISMSLRKIGALSSGETIEVTRQAEALSALQTMLRSWGAVANNVFVSVKDTALVLTAGKASYTWGTGGEFNSVRPNLLLGGYILDSTGVTHPVEVISEGRYRNVPIKTTSSRPYMVYLHPGFPLATAYFYPVPDQNETFYADSIKPFTEASSFAAVGNTIAFPVTYEEAIVYNLAIRLAPEYGKSVSTEVAAIAKTTLDTVKVVNAQAHAEPVFLNLPAGLGYGSGYSINSDSYR